MFFSKKSRRLFVLLSSDYFCMTILPILPRFWPWRGTPNHRAHTLFAGFLSNHWHFWQWSNNCQECQSTNCIANLANGPTARPPDRAAPRVARHGLLCQSDRSIVLFDRSFLLSAFCWRSPPPGPTAWPVGAGGSTRNFFYF